MISNKLKRRVLEEATLLKQQCTPEEVNTLYENKYRIDPNFKDICVYGLLTGNCYSERATELLGKCAVWPYSSEPFCFKRTDQGIKRWLNAKRIEFRGYSPIEYYIYHRQEKISLLVDYIAGKVEITVKDL